MTTTVQPFLFVALLFLPILSIPRVNGIEQKKFTVDKESRPKSSPPVESGKQRYLEFEYSFRSESVVYDVLESKEKTPSTLVEATLSFHILHHADGGVVGRWKLEKCPSDNCGHVPPVYVHFVRGGNNLESVHMDLSNSPADYVPSWNVALAMINSIYTPARHGEGDEQYVKTPYGFCNVVFSRPEDRRFRRQISDCDIEGNFNFTRLDGLTTTRYTQDVHYLQNVKVDADIVVIESVEELALRSPFDSRFGIVVETRSRAEMNNRTAKVVEAFCPLDMSADECILRLGGTTKVGDLLYEGVSVKEVDREKLLESKMEESLKELRELYSSEGSWSERHGEAAAEILQISSSLAHGAELLGKFITDENNYFIRAPLANALGALGGEEAVSIARSTLVDSDDGLNLARFLDDFLFGLAHTHSRSEKWHRQIVYWLVDMRKQLADDPKIERSFWHLANSIATVLWRECQSSPSSENACSKGKRAIINKYITEITSFTEENRKEEALRVLRNLPVPSTIDLAVSLLCSPASPSSSLQLLALEVLAAAPPSLINGTIISQLIRIIRNVCPLPSTTGESILAVDILLKTIPDQMNAAPLLLRAEQLLEPRDHELWAHIYGAIAASRRKSSAADELWSKMRAFRVFRPNYSQRALRADSTSFTKEITAFSDFRGVVDSSSEFAWGAFRASRFSLSAEQGKGSRAKSTTLFQLELATSGTEPYVGGGSGDSESDRLSLLNASPKATARLSLLSHSLPEAVLFDGHHALISRLMEATGARVRVFDGAAPLRSHSSDLPLLSGLSLSLSISGSVAFRLSGAAEVSIWNREADVTVIVDTSSTLAVDAKLLLNGRPAHQMTSRLSMLSQMTSRTDTAFDKKPYRFCVNMGQAETPITLTVSRQDWTGRRKPRRERRTRRRVLPGATWRLDRTVEQQCRHWFENLAPDHEKLPKCGSKH